MLGLALTSARVRPATIEPRAGKAPPHARAAGGAVHVLAQPGRAHRQPAGGAGVRHRVCRGAWLGGAAGAAGGVAWSKLRCRCWGWYSLLATCTWPLLQGPWVLGSSSCVALRVALLLPAATAAPLHYKYFIDSPRGVASTPCSPAISTCSCWTSCSSTPACGW